MQLTTLEEEGFSWLRLVERSGAEGRDWVRRCRSERSRALQRLANQALQLMRRRQLGEGHRRLQEFRARRQEEPRFAADLEGLFGRIDEGVTAYFHYCRGETRQALIALGRAEACLIRIVSLRPCLSFLAMDFCEFALHRARLARNRGDWSEMARHVEIARRMHLEDEPLCRRLDGVAVTFSGIRDTYCGTAELSSEERSMLEERLRLDHRLEQFQRFVAAMYLLPGFVIPPPGGC